MKKYILKDILLRTTENIRNEYKDILRKGERRNEKRINASKLLAYNNANDYKNTIFSFKNKNILRDLHKDKMIENYIRKIMTQQINAKGINIQYSDPIFYHTLNKVYVLLFIYNPKDMKKASMTQLTNENMLVRLVNKLFKVSPSTIDGSGSNKESLVDLFNKNIYAGEKEIVIEPIYLTYDYLDSKIFSKTISSNIFKYNQYKGLYSNMIAKNTPLVSPSNLMYNKLYNKKLLYKLLTLTDTNNLLNAVSPAPQRGTEENGLDTNINSANSILQLLLYKNIIGYDWVYKGKLAKSDSNARSVYSLKQYGTLTNSYSLQGGLFKTEKSIFSLNKHPSYITKNSNNLINKNGKYNISVTLSHL